MQPPSFLSSLIFLVCFSFPLSSQPCLPGEITFSSQEQIDNFQTDYPGCTEIEGSVNVWSAFNTPITNLNGLSVLTAIHGFLIFFNNPGLASLSGLENLEYVGGIVIGDVEWGGNSSLVNLKGLEGLTQVGSYLTIEYNLSLASLEGLENLTYIGESVFISTNGSLLCLKGLDNLKTVGGELFVAGNEAMVSLDGLESLTTVGKGLVIGWDDYSPSYSFTNSSLTNIKALKNLKSAGGYVEIECNPLLPNLDGLEKLSSIDGGLHLVKNNSLEDLGALHHAISMEGDLRVRFNPKLAGCHVYSICKFLSSPSGNVDIAYNKPGCNTRQEVEAACGIIGVTEPPASGIQGFPNPTTGIVEVKGLEGREGVLRVQNGLGQILLVQTFSKDAHVDLSGFPPGLYWVDTGRGGVKVLKE